MNIQTVAENLRNTIAGKEKYLAEWDNVNITDTADRIHRATIMGMLKVNIDELKRILQDVQQCLPKEYTMGDWNRDMENPHGNRDLMKGCHPL